MNHKKVSWIIIGLLSILNLQADITVDGKTIKEDKIKDFIKNCTLCDHAGKRHVFRKKNPKNTTNFNQFDFSFKRSKKTLTPDLEEISNALSNRCTCCLNKDLSNQYSGKDLLTNVYKNLQKCRTQSKQVSIAKESKNEDKIAQYLANKIFMSYTNSGSKTVIFYGEEISQEIAKKRFEKYKKLAEDTSAKDETQRKIIFDDLCALGFVYQEHEAVPQKRASNFDELCKSFEEISFCETCQEKLATNLQNEAENKQYEPIVLWDITRPDLPVNPYASPGSQILYLLNALRLSDITVDEYASTEGSCLFGTLFGIKKNMPARSLELDSRWAEHYKSKNPDSDPAEKYYTEDAPSHSTSLLKTPLSFIKKNIPAFLAGTLSTYFLVDPFNKEKHTKENLTSQLKNSMFTWSGALDTALFVSNLIPPNIHSKQLHQAAKNYNMGYEWVRNIGNFALGRGFSPLIMAQALGADQGAMMGTNVLSSLIAGNNKFGLGSGQSLGLLLRGHYLPAILSGVVPVLFGLTLNPNAL